MITSATTSTRPLTRHHPGSVLDDDRNADTSLQEITLPILAQVTAQVGQNAGMGDLHVVVVPVPVPIDAEVGQRPALGQIFGHCNARRALSSHRCSIISPLATRDHVNARLGRRTASPRTATRGAPQLALLFDHFTARLGARRASARTAFRSFHRSPRRAARRSSHCFSIISPLASARGAPQLALPSNTTLA